MKNEIIVPLAGKEVNRTFTVKKNSTNFSNHVAKTPQNTGGGSSQKNVHHLGVASEMPPRCLRDASVSIYSCQSDFSSRVWKYTAMILLTLTLGVGNAWGASPYTIDFTSEFSGTGNKSVNNGTITVNASVQSKTYNNSGSTKVAFMDDSNYLTVSASSACITAVSITANTDNNSNTHQIQYQTSSDGSTWASAVNVSGTFANRQNAPSTRDVSFSPAVQYVRFHRVNNSISVGAITITYSVSEDPGGDDPEEECSKIFAFAYSNDATTADVTNSTSTFTGFSTGSNNCTGSITIDGKPYSITKRGSNSTFSITFSVPANKEGTLYGLANSNGSTVRTITLSNGNGYSETQSSSNSSGSAAAITYTDMPAGSYTLSSNGTASVPFLCLKLCDASSGGCTNVGIGTQPTSSVAATVGVACSITGLVASGTNPSYQWYTCNSDGSSPVAISAAGAMSFTGYTTATLGLTPTAEGTTYYKCVVSGQCGDPVTSNVVTVNATPKYSVTYNDNGKTGGGAAPTDDTKYANGTSVTVLGNTNTMTKDGYVFGGWNTENDGTGTNYAPGATFEISDNTTLYAEWIEGSEATITYVFECSTSKTDIDLTSATPTGTNKSALSPSSTIGGTAICSAASNDANTRTGKINVGTSKDTYVQFSFTVAANYQLRITDIDFKVLTVGSSNYAKQNYEIVISDGTHTYSGTKGGFTNNVMTGLFPTSYGIVEGDVTVKIYGWNTKAADTYRMQKTNIIKGVVVATPVPVCAAPTSVTIAPTEIDGNYGWRYSLGETIDLTCSYTGGTGTASYQWQKYVEDNWVDINTATNASAGTARLQIAECTSGDGGSYRCVVSMGTGCELASAGYFLRVFTLNGNYNDDTWSENAITWTGQYTGTATLNLNASSLYKFKVTDNNGKWFGNGDNNIIISAISWDCGINNSECRLFTGPAGNYVATIDITHAAENSPYVNVQLAYPSVTHPAEGYTYFEKPNEWTNVYLYWYTNDDNRLTDWDHTPEITTSTTICEKTYYYSPLWDKYDYVIYKGNGTNQWPKNTQLSTTGCSRKYLDKTDYDAPAWAAFATYTISFDGNGKTSGEMSAIADLCPGVNQALTANAFEKTGYNFTGWVANVDVTVSGETVSAGSVIADEATIEDIAGNITLTAQWESNCPTTGTVFSLVMKSGLADEELAAGTNLPLNSSYATVTGGTATLRNNDTKDNRARIRNSEANFDGANAYIKVELACEMQIGDEITITSTANQNELWFTNTDNTESKIETDGRQYTIIKDDLLENRSVFYIWRKSGGTNVGTITITRPAKYAVSYESAKGTAPTGGTVSSVTLAEITGVAGWKNTGWKANVATEVGGETVAANTLIANGTKVTLTAATTFTAQWAQLYTITTGSPANGTVEADKASAVAGATITLTATPSSGYKLSAWDVYKTDDASTKVSVTNNQFTMPAYGVTISAEFVESVVLYDYAVMAEAGNHSFTDEEVKANGTETSKTFGTEGNPQLIISNAGWDSKGNIINSFIKFFGGTSSMSVVVPAGRKATVTIKYGSYNANDRYLLVNGTAQAKPIANMVDGITTETFGNYMRTVELTNQTGTLVLTANASGNNLYIAYVDVTLTGNASYGVTYHLNEGTWNGDAGAATYTYGTGIASLATNVTKNGYDFAGWYGNEGLTGDAITSIATTVTGDKEFWAAWTPKSYTLTWNWDGGSCSGVAGTDYTAGGSVAYGATINYPDAATMSKDGAAFAGWSTSAVTMPAEALTITALWAPEHAITYKETKGATNTNPETYVQGVGVASFAPLADVANFHFTGWSPTSIGTDATEDMDVTAQWVAAYDVTFSAGEGSGTVPATFQKWATATFELPGQGDMVAPAGKVFVGWKANGAGETRAEGYEYTMTAAAVEFVAQWKAVTLLINYDGENYSLNTTDFQTGVELVDGVAGYAKQAKFGNTTTSVTGIDVLSKGIIYHTKTNATKVTITAYNNYGSNSTSTFHYSVVAEGVTSTPSVTNKTLDKFTGDSYEINMTGRSTLYIMTSQKELRICQVEIEENGTANKVAPDVEYSVNLNKQRPFLPAEATIFEGITYRGASSYKPVNGQVQISTCGTDYYSFTIPEGQTRQLQLTVNGNSKYIVSKTLGDNTEAKKVSGNKNFNLTAGTWYINPQGSNVNVTTIAFDETPDPITVTFKDGLSTLSEQALFVGDKVTAPTAPTKSGYRFVKWQLGGEDYNFSTPVTTDIVLDAVWQKTWTVTFDSDGGTAVDPQVVDDGGVATIPDPAPEKAGHSLVRWYKVTGEEGQEETDYSFSTAVTADMTLKALWHELQNDPSLSALSYDGHDIDLNSGVDNEGVLTFTYELPYKGEYDAEKLSVTKAASSATLSDITYTPATKTASFSVTAADGPVVQNYAVVFTNAPKDMLCLVWAEMTADNTLTLDEDKSYLDIEVTAAGGVKEETTKQEYQGYTGYKFRSNGSYTELKDGNFKSGDKVDVFVVAAIGDKMRVYSANEAIDDNIVAISENNMVQGHNPVTLTADAASLYLRRGDGEETYKGWNPHIAYMAVYRAYPVPVVKTITFNGAAGVIDGTTITATIPYTTNMASLPIEATFMSNDPGTTTGNVGGPWVDNDGVYTNSYVVTDKDGDTNTYSITLTRAEVSHDASLTALAVEGYEISFDPATLSYDVQLPYGATVGDIPAVTYTAATGATAVKTDAAEMPDYTTIAVTAEDGSTVQEYKIYFHANQIPSIVIYDGTTEMEFATESNSQLVTWTSVDAGTTIQNSGATINNKEYAHNVKVFGGQTSASRNMDIVIPADYMAKFYLAACSNSDSEADIYITKDAVGAKADAVVSVSGDRTQPAWSESDFVASGHYFLNATNSTRLYELSVTLYPIGYTRNVTAGRLGTICLPHGGTMRGAAVYEVAYFNPENKKIYFDEVLSGEMEPGMPYVFLPDEGNNDKLVVMYGNNVPAATAGHKNGLYGYFSNDPEESYNVPKNAGNYIISENKYWYVDDDITYVPQNRAYLRVTEMIGYNGEPAPTPAYGRRRVVMDAGAQAPQVTTGVDEINSSEKPVKLMIKGQIFILRGEKMYDVTGKVVK